MTRVCMPLIASLLFVLCVPVTARSQPPAYSLSAESGEVAFTVSAQMLFKVKEEGRFRQFTGELSYDPQHPADTRVDLTVYTATVDMRNTTHADLLRSAEFFDVARFPTMRFVSAASSVTADGSLALAGDLTIRGITRRIVVPVTLRPAGATGAGRDRFETSFEIDRTEFGLNGAAKLGGFHISIAKKVRIRIALAAGQPTS